MKFMKGMFTNGKTKLMVKVVLLASLFLSATASAYNLSGLWRSVDENTKQSTSIIKIYRQSNKYYGKIVHLYDQPGLVKVCNKCSGSNAGANVIGMRIINDLTEESSNSYDNGSILDPKSGSVYSLKITQLSPSEIKLRGYIGFSWLGRTQYWKRFTGDVAKQPGFSL